MFSRKEKPTGRRPPSMQSDRSRASDDIAPGGYGSRFDDGTGDAATLRPAAPAAPPPLALPPIPRVASQYGAHGPVNMSELERKLRNFELDESKQNTIRQSEGIQFGYGQSSRNYLETIHDTEAQLTGVTPAHLPPQGARTQAPLRPRTVSSNFSRPRLIQSPPTSDEPSTAQRPAEQERAKPQASLKPNETVRLVPSDGSIIKSTFPASRVDQTPIPENTPSRQETIFQSAPQTTAVRTSTSTPPSSVSASVVPPPPLRRPPPPPLAPTDPASARPKTAPSDAAAISEFRTVHSEADTISARPTSRGLRSFRRSTEEKTPIRATPPLPLQPIAQHGMAAGEASALRPPSAKWASLESPASTIAPPTEIGPTKSSKTVRSRFNPISLITRRKTGQSNRPQVVEPFSPPLPADFDPRIRGSLIHDFSAPRTRPDIGPPPSATSRFPPRTTSINQGVPPPETVGPTHAKKPSPREQPRTPVFIEDFGDHTEAWRLDEKDRRNQNTTGIADRVPEQVSEKTITSLPAFARRTQSNALHMEPVAPPPQGPLPPTPTRPVPSMGTSQPIIDVSEVNKTEPNSIKPAPQTPPIGSRSPSVSGSGGLLAPTPARLKSNASSRFSFDLAGVGSAAQEKLLEEKHRQRTAQKARESSVSGISIVETDDEDNGYDEISFGGYDEETPGMDSDDDNPFPNAGKVSDFVLPPSNSTTDVNPPGLQNSWDLSQPLEPLPISEPETLHAMPQTSKQATPPNVVTDEQSYEYRLKEMEQQMSRSNFVDDDDLYFHDGDIDTGEDENENFDESVFDDESNTVYGLPLRDQKKRHPVPQDTVQSDSSQQSTRPMSLESTVQAPNNAKATTDTSRTSVQPVDASSSARKIPILDPIPQSVNTTASLTQDNLAAYHDALAHAANKAAKDGRFDRKMSMDEHSADADVGLRAHVSFQDHGLGSNLPPTEEKVLEFDFDDLDDVDDDDVIAAANAEALENDDEDFYGTEFGFYANGTGVDAERVHGGYFGSSFNDMVKRKHSGRGKDPSLTPITERSEWSQRNSVVSLALQSGGERYSAAHTPGLAQLADSMQHDGSEDNLSLSALMRLRRSAFGDSTTSLPSSAGSVKSGSPSGMPLGYMFPQPPTLGPVPHTAPLPRNNSAGNLAMGPPDLPARLQQVSGPAFPLLSPTPPATTSGIYQPDRGMNPSPNRRPVSKGPGHSRTSSGAESVTYTKDEEGGRWVMERRRTSEAGEVEILGRQVLEGQRI